MLALEDIVESILGQEIFEHDDLAVDMRELARRRHLAHKHDPNQSTLINAIDKETNDYWVHNLSPFIIEFSGSWTAWGLVE